MPALGEHAVDSEPGTERAKLPITQQRGCVPGRGV